MARNRFQGRRRMFGRLDLEIEKMRNDALDILMKNAVEVRSEGTELTPYKTGNLVNSWYGPVIVEKSKFKLLVEIGLMASYAPYVHEMVGANFTKPGTQAKFLEQPLKAKKSKLRLELRSIKR